MDHLVVVVDRRLTGPPARIGPGWLGEGVPVVEADGGGAIVDELAEATVILTAHEPVTAAMIEAAPRLRLIAKGGIGVDNIDVEAAHRAGVLVSNVPGLRSRAVAEHALYLVLALARQGWTGDRAAWMAGGALQLEGRVMGVLGLGGIGSDVASLGLGIGMSVLAATRTPRSIPDVEEVGVEELFGRSDVVVNCLPGTDETTAMVGEALLRRLPSHALFVNVGRGTTVVTDDLVTMLKEGHLGGVGLDVTHPEPLPPDHPLRGFDRVIITPHVAGQSDIANAASHARFHSNVLALVRGGTPHDLV